jgi:hypothetical protein
LPEVGIILIQKPHPTFKVSLSVHPKDPPFASSLM